MIGYIRNSLTLVLAFSISLRLCSQSLSFSESQIIMYKENNLIKAAEKQEEAYQFDLKSYKGLRFPQLDIFGAGIYRDKKIGTNLNGARSEVADALNISDPEELGNWDVNLLKRDIALGGVKFTWPLFTGGKINAAIEASKLKAEIGNKELVSTKNKLISELAERYFQVKLAEDALLVRKQVLDGMNQHLYNATKMEQQGLIAPVEKLQADVAVSEANRQYLAAQKDAELARVALANTLGIDQVNEELTTPFFIVPYLHPLDYYQDFAVENYPELQKLQLQVELTEQSIKSKKSTYYPTISALGNSILIHNNPIGGMKKNRKPWSLGVGMTYTIFNGLQYKNEIKSAKATKESVLYSQDKAKKDIRTLIEKIFQDIQKQEEQIQNLDVQIVQAEELLRVRVKGFSEGVQTSTDVVDAEINLSGIKLQKIQASYNYVVDLASLLEYSGLSQDFIKYTNQ